MSILIVTGSSGLIGSESVRHLAAQFDTVVGLDNDMRSYFFGGSASTDSNRQQLVDTYPNFRHTAVDIRDKDLVGRVFEEYGDAITAVIHTAAQPSHDWAAREPETDFTVNANGTLNLLEQTRRVCPEAVFIFTSTNKVYGDRPNMLPLVEQDYRWEIDASHPFADGINESMSVDACMHSLFGVSKLAADVMVQEYGRYFGMKTAVFRGGCLTGPCHAGAELHGFLAYLFKCVVAGTGYRIFGYKGKQVRDNIHAADLVAAFEHVIRAPRAGGEVYNIGGGRHANVSVLEAIDKMTALAGRKAKTTYIDEPRSGDHIWYVSDVSKFQAHYPTWQLTYDIDMILQDMYERIQAPG
jgi:CDP-paratose 2-epimerase